MSILVTGATGFVGSAVSRALEEAGFAVKRATRSPASASNAVAVGDIGPDTDWSAALAGVDAIVHTAARVHVMDDHAADPLASFRCINTAGTRRLAEAASLAGVRRLVFISSIKVNGESTEPGKPFKPNDVPAPVDPYGQSKLEAEQTLTNVAATKGLEVVIIRPPLIYGPGVKANFDRLMRLVYKGVPLPLGSVENRRSMVALENLTDLIMRCITSPRVVGKTLLVSDGQDLSTPALIQLMAYAMTKRPRLISVPERLLYLLGTCTGKRAEIQRLCGSLQIDSSDTRRLLDWCPPLPVEEAIQRTATAFLKTR